MKKYYLDKRNIVNGKKSNIHLDNSFSLEKYIRNVIDNYTLTTPPLTGSDSDWFVENTITAPTNNNDTIYRKGQVGIGMSQFDNINYFLEVLGNVKFNDDDLQDNHSLFFGKNINLNAYNLNGPGFVIQQYPKLLGFESNINTIFMFNGENPNYGGSGSGFNPALGLIQKSDSNPNGYIPYEKRILMYEDDIEIFSKNANSEAMINLYSDYVSLYTNINSSYFNSFYLSQFGINSYSTNSLNFSQTEFSYNQNRLFISSFTNFTELIQSTGLETLIRTYDFFSYNNSNFSVTSNSITANNYLYINNQNSYFKCDTTGSSLGVNYGFNSSQINILPNIGNNLPGIQMLYIPEYTDNIDAINNGLFLGAVYRTGDVLKIVH